MPEELIVERTSRKRVLIGLLKSGRPIRFESQQKHAELFTLLADSALQGWLRVLPQFKPSRVSDVSENVSDLDPFRAIFDFSENAIQSRKTVLFSSQMNANFLAPAASTLPTHAKWA